jgi:tetratricopeptide (TPR) repeat protein
VPLDADVSALDKSVRGQLRSLSKPNADAVARYLVRAGELLDDDPLRALEYARAAAARAGRVGVVREAVGVAAYRAGEWNLALTELRTARRITGDSRNLALIADCERALGRPGQAVKMLTDPVVAKLDAHTRVELLIVVAGARRDAGQLDAALAVLARGGLDRNRPGAGAARLWYAYADALEAAGRRDEAAAWFAASAEQDPDDELGAGDRAAALL